MRMEFGVLQFFGRPERDGEVGKVYNRAVERARIMDDRGYEAIWLAEHHFTGYSLCPSVHMMGVHIANHTRRLRIGTAVSLAPFYHPLRLAEEVALLDVLSGGRVNWGAGRGFDPVEFKIFNVPVEESGKRFHEAVGVAIAAWTQERMSWSGDYWRFENVEVLPKPVQQPHPPVWLAAGSEGAVRWAGKHGYSMLLGPHSTFQETEGHYRMYLDELRAAGHGERPVPMARFVALAETDAEAEQIARRGVRWLIGAYMNSSKATRPGSREQEILTMDDAQKIERYVQSVVIHGCAQRVIDKLQELSETMHLTYLMAAPLSQWSFDALTARVLPHFQ